MGNNTIENTRQASDSIHVNTDTTTSLDVSPSSDTTMMVEFNIYGEYENFSPTIMNNNSCLYAQCDINSTIIKKADRGIALTILEYGGKYDKIEKTDTTNNKVKYIEYILKEAWKKVVVAGDTGYMKAKNISYYTLKNSRTNCNYYISFNEFPREFSLIIYKFDIIQNQFVDTLTISPWYGSDSDYKPDAVKLIENIAFDNVSAIIDIYRTDEYCGGGEFDIYVGDLKDSLSIIHKTGGGGEMCESSYSSIRFPNIDKKEFLELKLGSLLEKEIYKIISTKKILKNNIAVEHLESTTALKNTTEESNEEYYNCKSVITEDKSVIYQWSGNKLIELKTIDYLKTKNKTQ